MSSKHPYRLNREQGKSPDQLRELFAEQVIFHSPIFRKPVEGRDLVLQVMKNSLEVRDGRYTAEFRGDRQTVLVWAGSINGMSMQSFELLEEDGDGLIIVRTVAMRPYPAVSLFRDAMRARLGQFLGEDYW